MKSDFEKSTPKCDGRIIPVILDITKEDDIIRVQEQLQIELKDSGLHMLMNNAGLGLASPIELMPFKDFKLVIDVNLLGHVHVTQKLLPLIRKAGPGARIVNITSLAGKIAGYHFGAYSASKFGLEAVTDVLRRELFPFGISVSAIEPGFAKTPMVAVGNLYLLTLLKSVSEAVQADYAAILEAAKEVKTDAYERAMDPQLVVDKIIHAFTSPTPQIRYPVGTLALVVTWMTWLFPDSVIDFLLIRGIFLRSSALRPVKTETRAKN